MTSAWHFKQSHHKFNNMSSSLQSQSSVSLASNPSAWSHTALILLGTSLLSIELQVLISFQDQFRKGDFHRQKWDIGTQEALNIGLFTCKLMIGIYFQEMQNAAIWLYSHKGRLYSLWNSHFGVRAPCLPLPLFISENLFLTHLKKWTWLLHDKDLTSCNKYLIAP